MGTIWSSLLDTSRAVWRFSRDRWRRIDFPIWSPFLILTPVPALRQASLTLVRLFIFSFHSSSPAFTSLPCAGSRLGLTSDTNTGSGPPNNYTVKTGLVQHIFSPPSEFSLVTSFYINRKVALSHRYWKYFYLVVHWIFFLILYREERSTGYRPRTSQETGNQASSFSLLYFLWSDVFVFI